MVSKFKVGDRVRDCQGDLATVTRVVPKGLEVLYDYRGYGCSGFVWFDAHGAVECLHRVNPLEELPVKERYTLIPSEVLREVALVLTHGAQKRDPTSGKTYTDFGWRIMLEEQGYEKVRDIYLDSIMRHLNAFQRGEVTDVDSGMPALVHVIACGFILRDLERLSFQSS